MPDSPPRQEQPITSPAATPMPAGPALSGNPSLPGHPVQPADLAGLLQPYGDPTRPVRPGESVGRVLDGTAFPPLGDTRAPLGIDLVTGELMARELGVLERMERPAAAAAPGTSAAVPAPTAPPDPTGPTGTSTPPVSAGTPHTLTLRPLVTVSLDRLSVLADVHATDHRNRPLDPDVYLAAATRLGVGAGPNAPPLDTDALQTALRDAARLGPRTGVLLARGTPPEHGRDGRLEFLAITDATCVLAQDEGRVACSDRWPHFTVAPGDKVARLFPPTPGAPGVDVFGAHVAQRPGAPLRLTPGSGIRALDEDDGCVLFVASTPGLVDVARDEVAISPLRIIDGDVDLATGDISVPDGSACVRGSVRSGVTLTVRHHVLVEDAVENARVRCGGNLMVRGGIVMGRAGREAVGSVTDAADATGPAGQTNTVLPPGIRSGAVTTASPASPPKSAPAAASTAADQRSGAASGAHPGLHPGLPPDAASGAPSVVDAGIEAGGNVVAAHAAFALITAGGDVVVPSGVTGSRITAGGRFLAPGRGVVIGSVIRVGGGIDIGEAGSVAEVPTRLMVQPDTTQLNALLRERDTLADRMARISAELPPGPDMAVLLQTPEEDRTLVEALIRMRNQLDTRQKEMGSQIALDRKRYHADMAASPIIIRRRTHGGVRVLFGGRGHDAIPADTGVQYVWRAAAHRVAVEAAPTTPTERLFPPQPAPRTADVPNDGATGTAPSA